MRGLPFYFFALGILAVLIGMGWGIEMAISDNHSLYPAHAHLNLLGWVTFSIFAFYYHLVPEAAKGMLPKVHFSLAVAGLVLIVPGIVVAMSGGGEALAGIGSILTALSMLTFGIIVLRQGLHQKEAGLIGRK